MCEFVSWIEGPGKNPGQKQVWFLTDHEVYETSRGQELRSWSQSPGDEDCLGHGAIRWYYGLEKEIGEERECINFKSPANFPSEIAEAILAGRFCHLVCKMPAGLLSEALDRDYLTRRETLSTDCGTKYEALVRKYKRLTPEYWAGSSALDKDYETKRKALDAEYWALLADPHNRAKAWVGI